MKVIQAAVLVLVGALGAMLFLRVKSGPEPQAPAAEAAVKQTATPAQAAEPAAAEPVPPAKKAPPRTAAASRRNNPVSKPVENAPVLITQSQPAQAAPSVPAQNT